MQWFKVYFTFMLQSNVCCQEKGSCPQLFGTLAVSLIDPLASQWPQNHHWISWIWLTKERKEWVILPARSLGTKSRKNVCPFCLYFIVWNSVTHLFQLKKKAEKHGLVVWPGQGNAFWCYVTSSLRHSSVPPRSAQYCLLSTLHKISFHFILSTKAKINFNVLSCIIYWIPAHINFHVFYLAKINYSLQSFYGFYFETCLKIYCGPSGIKKML